MPEQLAFARKASGLVRGLSMYDAFGIGIMTVQPIMGIWYMVLLGLGLFPGGNLLIAIGTRLEAPVTPLILAAPPRWRIRSVTS